MMMPLLGQLTRLWWRVVSAAIVSPQLTCWTAAALLSLKAMRTATAKARITASKTSVAGAAWRHSLAGIVSSLSGGARRSRASGRPYIRRPLSARLRGRRGRPAVDRRARDRPILEARSTGKTWDENAEHFAISPRAAQRAAASAARLAAEVGLSDVHPAVVTESVIRAQLAVLDPDADRCALFAVTSERWVQRSIEQRRWWRTLGPGSERSVLRLSAKMSGMRQKVSRK